MRRAFLAFLLTISACGGATEPGTPVEGFYRLDWINGSPLPFQYPDFVGFRTTVLAGSVEILPEGRAITNYMVEDRLGDGPPQYRGGPSAYTFTQNGRELVFTAVGGPYRDPITYEFSPGVLRQKVVVTDNDFQPHTFTYVYRIRTDVVVNP